MEETLRKQASKQASAVRFTLTKKIGFLLLMPLFGSLVSIAFFVGFMEETKTDGHFVNVAGQQRMLSIELREWARMVAIGQVEDRAGLQTRIAEFEKSLSAMERGGEVLDGLLVPARTELRGELAAVDKLWRTLKPDLVDVAVRPRGEPQFQEAYRRIEFGTDELQKLSHQLVTRFEEETQSLRRRMLYTLGIIACLMGAIFLVGIFLTRRYIVQPILRVDEAAKRISGGDFSQRLEIRTRDELSSLAHTFNRMAAETEQLLNALNLRRRYAETIIASVPAGLLVLRDDLAVLSANRSFRETFGVDEQAITRRPMVTELLPVSGLKEAALEVLSTGEAKRNLPMEMPAKDGSRRLLRISLAGTRLAEEEEEEEEARLLVIVEDVTEEEALRAAALESERRFQDLVQGLDAIVWEGEASGEGLRFTFVSRRAESILGFPVERWLAEPDFWKDRVHPDDRDAVSGFCRRILEHNGGSHGEGAAWDVEFRMQAADGRMVWFHNRAHQAAIPAGSRPSGVMTDITERKQAELENARLIEEVNQLNTGLEQKVAERTTALRLANQELESFSYSVSHDLRSPLNTIAGFSQLLAKQLDVSGNDKLRHYLSRIQAGAAQMGQLIADLLSLAQISRTQMQHELVDLSALARGILDDLQAHQNERQVTLQIESGLQAQADAGLVRVVMENLLGNAWKYSSKQAEAKISFGQQLVEAGEPVFFVRDNGAGFDMAYADKLFTPFQRLHPADEFPGTGIGLATVKRVIDRHGGRLWAEAAPGLGATFFFTLPKGAAAV